MKQNLYMLKIGTLSLFLFLMILNPFSSFARAMDENPELIVQNSVSHRADGETMKFCTPNNDFDVPVKYENGKTLVDHEKLKVKFSEDPDGGFDVITKGNYQTSEILIVNENLSVWFVKYKKDGNYLTNTYFSENYRNGSRESIGKDLIPNKLKAPKWMLDINDVAYTKIQIRPITSKKINKLTFGHTLTFTRDGFVDVAFLPLAGEAIVSGKVSLPENQILTDGQFEFKLLKDGAPESEALTAKNLADGSFSFSIPNLDKVGNTTYKLSQNATRTASYELDKKVYIVKVNTTKGVEPVETFNSTISLENEDNTSVDELVFNNTVVAEEVQTMSFCTQHSCLDIPVKTESGKTLVDEVKLKAMFASLPTSSFDGITAANFLKAEIVEIDESLTILFVRFTDNKNNKVTKTYFNSKYKHGDNILVEDKALVLKSNIGPDWVDDYHTGGYTKVQIRTIHRKPDNTFLGHVLTLRKTKTIDRVFLPLADEAIVKGKVSLPESETLAEGQFEFKLLKDGAPESEAVTAKNLADGSFSFSIPNLKEEEVTSYKLSQNTTRTASYKLDNKQYVVDVTVAQGAAPVNTFNATIIYKDATGTSVSEVLFENTLDTPDPITAEVKGKVTLDDIAPAADLFEFELTSEDLSSITVLETVKNLLDGTFTINTPNLTSVTSSPVIYQLRQKNLGVANYDYDSQIFTVEVSVDLDATSNTLMPTVIYKDAAGTLVTEVLFKNTVKTPSAITAEVKGKVTLDDIAPVADLFEFELASDLMGAMVPVAFAKNLSDGTFTINITNLTSVTSSPIIYELRQKDLGVATNNYNLDNKIYTVEVSVILDASNTLVPTVIYMDATGAPVTEALFENTVKTPSAITAEVKGKVTLGGIAPAADLFEFELTSEDLSSITVLGTVKNLLDGTFTINTPNFAAATSSPVIYQLRQKDLGVATNNYNLDNKIYTVEVSVILDASNTLVPTVIYMDATGAPVTEVLFENTENTPEVATASVDGKVELEGATLVANTFKFVIKKQGEATALPEVTHTTTDGIFTIDIPNLSEVTTTNPLIYELSQKNLGDANYVYDSKIYTVEVSVSLNGATNKFEATHVIKDPASNIVTVALFKNKYEVAVADETQTFWTQHHSYDFPLTADKKKVDKDKLMAKLAIDYPSATTFDGITASNYIDNEIVEVANGLFALYVQFTDNAGLKVTKVYFSEKFDRGAVVNKDASVFTAETKGPSWVTVGTAYSKYETREIAIAGTKVGDVIVLRKNGFIDRTFLPVKTSVDPAIPDEFKEVKIPLKVELVHPDIYEVSSERFLPIADDLEYGLGLSATMDLSGIWKTMDELLKLPIVPENPEKYFDKIMLKGGITIETTVDEKFNVVNATLFSPEKVNQDIAASESKFMKLLKATDASFNITTRKITIKFELIDGLNATQVVAIKAESGSATFQLRLGSLMLKPGTPVSAKVGEEIVTLDSKFVNGKLRAEIQTASAGSIGADIDIVSDKVIEDVVKLVKHVGPIVPDALSEIKVPLKVELVEPSITTDRKMTLVTGKTEYDFGISASMNLSTIWTTMEGLLALPGVPTPIDPFLEKINLTGGITIETEVDPKFAQVIESEFSVANIDADIANSGSEFMKKLKAVSASYTESTRTISLKFKLIDGLTAKQIMDMPKETETTFKLREGSLKLKPGTPTDAVAGAVLKTLNSKFVDGNLRAEIIIGTGAPVGANIKIISDPITDDAVTLVKPVDPASEPASATASAIGFKNLVGKTLKADMFEFQIHSVANLADPIPTDLGDPIYTVKNAADGSVNFEIKDLNKEGKFYYIFSEKDGGHPQYVYSDKRYKVEVSVSLNVAENKYEAELTVFDKPLTFYNIFMDILEIKEVAGMPKTICEGAEINLADYVELVLPVDHVSKIAYIKGQANPLPSTNIKVTETTTFVLKAKNNQNGEEDGNEIEIEIAIAPASYFTNVSAGDKQLKIGENVQLTAEFNAESNGSIQWFDESGKLITSSSPSANSSSIDVINNNESLKGVRVFTVKLTDACSGKVTEKKVEVEFFLDPEISIIQKNLYLLSANNNFETNGGYKFVEYTWYLIPTVGATPELAEGKNNAQNYTPNTKKKTPLKLTSQYQLQVKTEDGRVMRTPGIYPKQERTHKIEYTVYPNPVSVNTEITAKVSNFISSEFDGAMIYVYSTLGILKHSIEVKGDETTFTLKDKGVYYIHFKSNVFDGTKTIIVE